MRSSKYFSKSRTISLFFGLFLVILLIPGAFAADSSTPNAQYISDTIPATMNPGEVYSVSVTLKNTGGVTWNEASRIRLGGIGDATGDASKFSPTRITLPVGTHVYPGAQYTFTFTMTAPATEGSYTPKYRMIWEGYQWFGAQVPQPIKVTNQVIGSAAGPTAQFTASTVQGEVALTVQFTDLSGSAGTTVYKWDVNNQHKRSSRSA